MASTMSVTVPSFEFQYNLIVYPLPKWAEKNCKSLEILNQIFYLSFNGEIVTFTSLRTMLFMPSHLEGTTLLNFYLVMFTALSHLLRLTRES